MSTKVKGKVALDLNSILEKKTFQTFNDLRKEAFHLLSEQREIFVRKLLLSNGIKIDDNMTCREKYTLLESKNIEIRKGKIDKKITDCDLIYKGEELLGYWNNNYELKFDERGKFLCICRYEIM